MTHSNFLYAIAIGLMVYALFILMLWAGPIGVLMVGVSVHGILKLAELSPDRDIPVRVPQDEFDTERHWRR